MTCAPRELSQSRRFDGTGARSILGRNWKGSNGDMVAALVVATEIPAPSDLGPQVIQAFTAPAEIPVTKYRCSAKKTASGTAIEMKAAELIMSHSVA